MLADGDRLRPRYSGTDLLHLPYSSINLIVPYNINIHANEVDHCITLAKELLMKTHPFFLLILIVLLIGTFPYGSGFTRHVFR